VDPQSLALVPAIDAVFAARDAAGLPADSVASELSASCVELRSPAYGTVAELAADFPVQRRRLRDLVEGCGARVAAAGAHPFSEATAQEITGKALPQGRRGDGLARTNAGYLRAARPRLGPGRGARHPGRRGALPQRPALRRALGELALLGRVGHPPRLGPREGLRPHAAHRPAPRLPRLGGVRGLRGGPRSRRNHPGLLTVLVGRPPAPAARHGRAPRAGRPDGILARRLPGRPRSVPRGHRQRASSGRTPCSRRRTRGAPPATGSTRASTTSPAAARSRRERPYGPSSPNYAPSPRTSAAKPSSRSPSR
jgi:hypothetical protein